MKKIPSYSQNVKTSMTPAKPALIPAISLLAGAAPFVDDELAAVPVEEGLTVGAVVYEPEKVSPRLGSATLPLTIQPSGVAVGQDRVDTELGL